MPCKNVLITSLIALLCCSQLPVSSRSEAKKQKQEAKLKAKVEYNIELNQELKMRVIKIPTEYGMLERNWDGDVETPKPGSVIVAETIDDMNITTEDGSIKVLPSGTKFYARTLAAIEPQSFQKDGSVQLEFYKFELPMMTGFAQDKLQPGDQRNKSKEIYLRDQSLSADTKPLKSKKMHKALTVGVSTIAGAVGAPIATAMSLGVVGNILGLSTGVSPYLYGGVAALGGGIGLVYGLTRKGKMYRLEPGSAIGVRPSDKWQLSISEHLPSQEELIAIRKEANKPKNILANECAVGAKCPQDPNMLPVLLKVHKIKKTKDIYGSPCIAVSFSYHNNTKQELRYSSFVLVDSMGREYEATPISVADEFIGELPRQGALTMNFPSDFINTVHYLHVKNTSNQRTLVSEKIVLK